MMDTRAAIIRLSKVVKTTNWDNKMENGLLFVRMYEILNTLTNSSRRI